MKRNELFIPVWLRWIIGSTTLLGISILILSIVLGVRAGQQFLETRSRQQIATTLQRAIDFHTQGEIEAAFDAYRSVLVLDPDNPTATDGIAALLDRSGAAPAPAAVLPFSQSERANGESETPFTESSSSPSQSPSLTTSEREIRLFKDGQQAFQVGDWQKAIDNLVPLRESQSAYRANEVNDLLYSAYFSLATQQEELNQSELALQNYENAIAIHANPIGAEVAKELLTNYVTVLNMDPGSYPRLIATLNEIYQADPTYRDVSPRLLEAYEEYGDQLVGQREWCDAAEQYNKASEIGVTPGLLPKRDRYQAQCTQIDLAEPPVASASGIVSNDTVNEAVSSRTTAQNATATAAPQRVRPPTIPTVDRPDVTTNTTTGNTVGNISGNTTGSNLAEPAGGSTAQALLSASPVDTSPVVVDATPTDTVAPPLAPVTGRILYATRNTSDNRFRVFSQSADGVGQPTVLVEDGVQPAMRPDGLRLVYRNMRSDAIGISSFDPGTSLALRFTDYKEDSVPRWSADGNRVAFASNREGDRLWRIYTVWAEQGGATTNHGFGESPTWHPIQDLIVYRGCDDRGNQCGIWSMDGNGGNRRSLTNVQRDSHPIWSPDGRFVIFMSDGRDGNVDLYRLTVSSGAVERLTTSGSIDGIPAVSPSGEWVSFLSDRNGAWALWRIPLAGGQAERIGPIVGQVGEWQQQTLQWIP
ncbi:MAG: hypothetical protein AAF702_26940 [Chloroflexota bacterium]